MSKWTHINFPNLTFEELGENSSAWCGIWEGDYENWVVLVCCIDEILKEKKIVEKKKKRIDV